MKASILSHMKMQSPLRSLKKISPEGAPSSKKSLFFSLNLTTLIDAFCILVIFLLSNMNGRVQHIQENEKISLPMAAQTDLLTEGLVVRLENENIFINDQLVNKDNVISALVKAYQVEKKSLIIQADKKSNYESIAFIMRAGGQAGYEKYVFAVLPGT